MWGEHSCPPLLVLTFRKNSRATKNSAVPKKQKIANSTQTTHRFFSHKNRMKSFKNHSREISPQTRLAGNRTACFLPQISTQISYKRFWPSRKSLPVL